MRALSIVHPGASRVVEVDPPALGGNDVLVRVACCGVCGTDVHIFRGEYLGTYPIVPGHECAGTIEAMGSEVTGIAVGDRVALEPNLSCGRCEACLNNRQNFCEQWQAVGVTLPGGMAEYVVAPREALFDIGDLSFEAAAFMEPLSCVIHGLGKLTVDPGARAAVLGAGPIGMQLLRTLRTLGAGAVTVVDHNRSRLDFARSDGAAAVLDDIDELETDYYDCVIEAAGVPTLLAAALRAVRHGGEVLLFGVAPQGVEAAITPFQLFRKGVTIHGSYTSVRNSYQALRLLASERVRVDDLISHRVPLDRFEEGVTLIEEGRGGVMKVMIVPEMSV